MFKLYLYGIEIRLGEIGITKKNKFKLYLYGIEILLKIIQLIERLTFKLYLYGIEITNRHRIVVQETVQIVPLWN